jgi:hypothetical protein
MMIELHEIGFQTPSTFLSYIGNLAQQIMTSCRLLMLISARVGNDFSSGSLLEPPVVSPYESLLATSSISFSRV